MIGKRVRLKTERVVEISLGKKKVLPIKIPSGSIAEVTGETRSATGEVMELYLLFPAIAGDCLPGLKTGPVVPSEVVFL